MRVITGSARGRKLEAVPGKNTRPTTDRMKESIFNIIQFDLEGRTVLDLFCGTGQMGIEALSRGAARAVFVDMSAEAVRVARQNVEHTGLTERAQIVGGEAMQFLATASQWFDVIFLDPPYRTPLLAGALCKITEFDILNENGIIVCECEREERVPVLDAPYWPGKRYDYGNRSVVLFTRREVEA